MKIIVLISLALVALADCRPSVSNLPSNNYLPAPAEQLAEEKNVYFYASPDDGYSTKLYINVVPKTQKNTKVIFVKAPHHAGVIPEVNAPQSLAEDRTTVYVLVKQPSQEQSISVPANLGIKQLKPEVYFIKYNNKQEAESEVRKGVDGHQVGVNVPDLENEHSFINVLDSQTNKDSVSQNGTDISDIVDTSNTIPKKNDDSHQATITLEAPKDLDTKSHTVIITEGEESDNTKQP